MAVINNYPFDPTGTAPTNRVLDENHTLYTHVLKDYHFIIPKLAPFFNTDVIIVNITTGQPLVEGIDYVFSHQFITASRAAARSLYGSITILDKTVSGVLRISYNTIGGDWNISEEEILELLVDKQTNPRVTTWEQVTNYPVNFPSINHQWHLDDMIGMSEVRDELVNMADTIGTVSDIKLLASQHYANSANPHNVTKSQVGLGNVFDGLFATTSQARLGVVDTAYMTPLTTKAAIEQLALTVYNDFIALRNNPHSVTKAQVGLEFVNNFPMADAADAITGVKPDRYMSPITTKVAVDTALQEYPTYDQMAVEIANNYGTVVQIDLGWVE